MSDEGVARNVPYEQFNQHGIDGLGNVRRAWRELGANAQYFFQTPEWMDHAAALIEGDLAWGVLTESGRPAAVSVLRHSQRKRAGIGFRALEEARVGDWLYPYTDCVLDRKAGGRRTVDLDDVAGISGPWDVLDLRALRVGSPWIELAVGRAYLQEEPDGGVGILGTCLGSDDWGRALPKNMRDSIRKARGRIEESGGSQVIVSTGAGLPAAYEQFVALEASGWKGAEGTALSLRPAMQGLLRDYLSNAGTAQIRSLLVGDRLAASQVGVTVGGSLFLLKVAYDEQLAHLSPGNVLMVNLVEECCDDPEVDRIDCTVWQKWHQRWGMVREPTYRLLAFNHRSVGGVVAGAAWHTRRFLTQQRGWRIAEAEGKRNSAWLQGGQTPSTGYGDWVERTG